MLSKIIKYLALIATIATVASTLYDATTILTKIGFMKKIINISDEMVSNQSRKIKILLEILREAGN